MTHRPCNQTTVTPTLLPQTGRKTKPDNNLDSFGHADKLLSQQSYAQSKGVGLPLQDRRSPHLRSAEYNPSTRERKTLRSIKINDELGQNNCLCHNELQHIMRLIQYNLQFRDPLELQSRSAVEHIMSLRSCDINNYLSLASTLYLNSKRNKIHRFHLRKSLRFALDVDSARQKSQTTYSGVRLFPSREFLRFFPIRLNS